jgi:hypothetical protein
MENCAVDQGTPQLGPRDVSIGSRPGALITDVAWGFGYGKFTTNAVQVLAISGGVPTSGGIEFVFNTVATASNLFNSTQGALAANLQAEAQFSNGQAGVSGGPWPYEPLYVSFGGQFSGVDQPLFTTTSNGFNNGATVVPAKYVVGGLHEVYLVVIQPNGVGTSTLWEVTNPANDGWVTTSWRSVGTGLDSPPWEFEQYQDKIYAVNGNTGIGWYQLGGVTPWSIPAGIPGVATPSIASVTPKFTYGTAYGPGGLPVADVSSWGTFVNWGTNPTVTAPNGAYGGWLVKLNAAATSFAVSMVASLNTTYDFSTQDFWLELFSLPPTGVTIDPGSIGLQLINTTPVTISPDQADGGFSG